MATLTLILQALAAFGPDIPEIESLVQQAIGLASQSAPVTNAELADIFRNLAVVHDHLQALTAPAPASSVAEHILQGTSPEPAA